MQDQPTSQQTDAALVMRWAELFALVIGHFQADQRDLVTNIEGDFSTLGLRVRASQDGRWVARTLTERELASTDLREYAKRLYAEARAAAD